MTKIKVEYVSHMGSDDMVVDAARVSLAKTADQYTAEQNEKLIKYLAKHMHWSPFAHCQIQFRISIPIFLARQSFKHIVGSVKNEVSRRYVQSEPEFYMPTWRKKPEGSIKQGSGDEFSGPVQDMIQSYIRGHNEVALDMYNALLKMDVAPEQARCVLPLSLMTEYVDTGSLMYWARVYNQRADVHSQKEWGAFVDQLDAKMIDLFPISWPVLKFSK